MEKWIDRSFRHIGKYFKCSNPAEMYKQLSQITNNLVHVHSMYSIFDSTQSTDDLCEKAIEVGSRNVTLTDHGTLLGIEPFMKSGAKYNINTIPGVETYREDRCHMILIAMNYKGYVDISHAMREANTNLYRKKIKTATREYAIMTKEMCEHFFAGNKDVIATSACIQGTISTILLTNKRIEKGIRKDLEKIEQYEAVYNQYNACKKSIADIKSRIAVLGDEKKRYTKYIGKGFISKLERNKDRLSQLEEKKKQDTQLSFFEDDVESGVETLKEQIETDEGLLENAKKILSEIEKETAALKSKLSVLSEKMKLSKPHADSYMKAKKIVDSTELYDEDVLYEKAREEIQWYKKVFSNFFIELQYHGIEEEAYVMPILVKLAREEDVPLIAANDAHMKDNSDDSIEARRIVRYNMICKAQDVTDADRELFVKTDAQLAEWLMKVVDKEAVYEAIFNTRVLNACNVEFPKEEHYPTVNSDVSFESMIQKGIQRRLSEGKIKEWTDEYQKRMEHELKIMTDMGYVDYHKVVEDFCREGRILGKIPKDRIDDIPEDYSLVHEWINREGFEEGVGIGPGRGSAVGSLVCFVIGITNIDPLRYGLLFERFLNPERVSMPDIDTDIATRLRPTLIRYLKWKYGERAVCSIATENTYVAKASIQMAGRDRASQKYANLPKKEYDYMCRSYLKKYTLPLSDQIPEEPGMTLAKCEEDLRLKIESNEESRIIWKHAKLIEGKLQGTGVHAGGVIISDNDNINDYIPLAYNTDKNVWAAQCDMIVAEEKGLLKMDVLGLGTLDCISDCIRYIKKYRGIDVDIENIPFENEVFENLYAVGLTNSVFQFESPGMKSMLKQFKPTCFEDLILLVACYRPGPMQYLDNIIKVKNGEIPLTYKTPELEDILSKTYGAVVYQEQVMQIFQKLAGYSLGGADLVRRAMSKKKVKVLEKEREAFVHGDADRNIEGCANRGINENVANELFDEMMEFARYAFNKSHAAAYAYVSYQTAWLKYHYPTEYICAMFNNKDQDEYAPMIEDCMNYNIKLLPPDINMSYYECVIEDDNIRYGLSGIKGIGGSAKPLIDVIIQRRREGGYYESVQDFLIRNMSVYLKDGQETAKLIPNSMFEKLSNAGVFDSMGYKRESLAMFRSEESSPSELLSLVNSTVFEKGKDIGYNLNRELELFGTVITYDPLTGFQDDSKYGCVSYKNLEENMNCSIIGYATTVVETRDKYGQYIYTMDFRGKAEKLRVRTNSMLRNQISNPDDLLFKVVKLTGTYLYGMFFAKKMTIIKASGECYFADLVNENSTNRLTEILNSSSDDRDIKVRICCRYLIRDGKLTKVEIPRIVERMLSRDELALIKKAGAIVNKC